MQKSYASTVARKVIKDVMDYRSGRGEDGFVQSYSDVVLDLTSKHKNYTIGYSKDGGLFAKTKDIKIEGINFGPFKIWYSKSCPYDSRAKPLKPKFSVGGRFPHPHVNGDELCLGDEVEYTSKNAWISLRVADFFDIAYAVLNTYNEEDCYHTIEYWKDGIVVCSDCDSIADARNKCSKCNIVYCNGCDLFNKCKKCKTMFCDTHIGYCDCCDAALCRDCSIKSKYDIFCSKKCLKEYK